MKTKKNTNEGRIKLCKSVLCMVTSFVLICGADAEEKIVSDNFDSMIAGQLLTGRKPNINLTGNLWVTSVNSSTPLFEQTAHGNVDAVGGYQHGSAILLDSAGSYVKPTRITISADLRVGEVTGLANATDKRGLGLGFYKGVNVHSSPLIFAQGLMLDREGNLNLQTDYTFSFPVAYVGAVAFDPSKYYTLTYEVDTKTGNIVSIKLEGSTADYSSFYSTTLFSNAKTKYAGLYVSSTTANYGQFDNFSVSVSPRAEVVK